MKPFFARVYAKVLPTGHLMVRAGKWVFLAPASQVRVVRLHPWEHPDTDYLLERSRPVRELLRLKDAAQAQTGTESPRTA